MGLRIASMYLLEYAKRKYSTDYSETLSLGRQFVAFTNSELKKFQKAIGMESKDNSKYFESPFAEKIFQDLYGQPIHSMDAYNYENAEIIHDMNKPVPKEFKNKYTCIIDGGTTEHVFNYFQAIKNCMDMLKIGGHFISMVPTNNFNGHGLYQFSPELFYSLFTEENGFEIEDVFIVKFSATKKLWRISKTPQEAGERLQYNTNTPTEIFVVAKKTGERKEELSVQQIDYAQDWYNEENKENKKSSRDSLTGKIPRKLLFSVGQFIFHPLNKNKYTQKMDIFKEIKKQI